MRCLLRFREGSITCSELWIRMARLLMYSCRSGVMESPQSVSLSVYCVNTKASHARLSRIKSRSYSVAHRELIAEAIHDTTQYANNRAEL